jgi:hypothetical protein
MMTSKARQLLLMTIQHLQRIEETAYEGKMAGDN